MNRVNELRQTENIFILTSYAFLYINMVMDIKKTRAFILPYRLFLYGIQDRNHRNILNFTQPEARGDYT